MVRTLTVLMMVAMAGMASAAATLLDVELVDAAVLGSASARATTRVKNTAIANAAPSSGASSDSDEAAVPAAVTANFTIARSPQTVPSPNSPRQRRLAKHHLLDNITEAIDPAMAERMRTRKVHRIMDDEIDRLRAHKNEEPCCSPEGKCVERDFELEKDFDREEYIAIASGAKDRDLRKDTRGRIKSAPINDVSSGGILEQAVTAMKKAGASADESQQANMMKKTVHTPKGGMDQNAVEVIQELTNKVKDTVGDTYPNITSSTRSESESESSRAE